jgi:hypothetical protein
VAGQREIAQTLTTVNFVAQHPPIGFFAVSCYNTPMGQHTDNVDTRTPSPPYGYSRRCTHSREQQIHIVAEFHANKIRPSRIAYRVGIDIAFIEQLIAGEIEEDRFPRLVAYYRRQRYQQRLRDSDRHRGASRYEQQQRIEREFRQETDL